MKTDVYDSYARDGERVLHFDVLVEHGTTKDQAFDYGQKWLVEIGESPDTLKQSHCNFCHSESASDEVRKAIDKDGFFILQMEGCPDPIN